MSSLTSLDLDTVEFASFSQVVGQKDGERVSRGYHADLRRGTPIGQDEIVAFVADDELHFLDGRESVEAYRAAYSVSEQLLRILTDPAEGFMLDNSRLQGWSVDSIYAGAGHFMILSDDFLLHGLGDNRFGQLGSKPTPKPVEQPEPIEFFDGIGVSSVACGDHHTAVIDDNGGLYVFGSDAKGQCGGQSDASGPQLVTFPVEEQPDAVRTGSIACPRTQLLVACGSSHTIVSTTAGVFVTGSNDSGQLGLGDFEPRATFTRCPALDDLTIKQLLCSRWTTYVEVV